MFDNKQISFTEKNSVLTILANNDARKALVEFVEETSKFSQTLIYSCWPDKSKTLHYCDIANVARILPTITKMESVGKTVYRLQQKAGDLFKRFLFVKSTADAVYSESGYLCTKFSRDEVSLKLLRFFLKEHAGETGALVSFISKVTGTPEIEREGIKVVLSNETSLRQFDEFLEAYDENCILILHVPFRVVKAWHAYIATLHTPV